MDAAEIEAALSEVCGQLNAAHARLVSLVGEVLASRCWEGAGILTCEQWVAWKTGLSPTGPAKWWPWLAARVSCPPP